MSEPLHLPPPHSHWFDLLSSWRRRVLLPPNPPQWVHTFQLDFSPGRLADPSGLIAADTALRPAGTFADSRHPDGSVERLTVCLPVSRVHERDFARWVDLYYGAGAAPGDLPLEWDCARRIVRTPFYEAEFDTAGAIRRLTYIQIDHDLVDIPLSAGMSPVWSAEGKTAALTQSPTRFSIAPEPETGCVGRLAVHLDQETSDFVLHRRFLFYPSFFLLDFTLVPRRDLEFFSPLAIHHRSDSGYVIAPDGSRSSVSGTGATALRADGPLAFPGYVFSSQTGCFLWAEPQPSGVDPDRFLFFPGGPLAGLAAVGFGEIRPGSVRAGRYRFLPAPFAGDFTLDRARVLRNLLLNPTREAPRPEFEEARPPEMGPESGTDSTGRTHIQVGDLRFVAGPATEGEGHPVRLETAVGRPILWANRLYGMENDKGKQVWAAPSQARLGDGALHLETEMCGPIDARWRVHSRVVPRLLAGKILFEEERRHVLLSPYAAEARFRADLETPCGPPAWDSEDSTVFIPGQMARGNYCPGQWHGGGPKWGPSEEPETCEFCKERVAPGHANHWTFPASRLPNTWAAAGDRKAGVLALVAAQPRTRLGEISVGFRSPQDGTTTLRLATPITYEPWIPQGYARFDRHARRDTRTFTAGEEILWRIYYAGEATESLNGWFEYDKAFYGLNARQRPDAWKMTHEAALRLTLGSLYKHHYNPEHRIISYGTGVDARHAPIGFTGMSHCALALLEGGTDLDEPEWREAGLGVMNEIAWAFLHGPGFPYAAWAPNRGGWEPGTGEPGYAILCALDNLLEAIDFERRRGVDHREWERAARRCCDAWLNAQSDEGAYPLKHPAMGAKDFPRADYEASNITVGVIACLVEAERLFGETRYMDSALRAADYYGQLLDQGRLWGGPGDIEALVNSEVPMFYLRSFVRLALRTGEQRHTDWARDAAAWRLGFQFAHCWPLDHGSQLFRQGWAGLGSESASASNLHSVCFGAVNVPDYALARTLFEDPHWTERLRDLSDYATQQFGRFSGDADVLEEGMGTESWWTSDTRWGKGSILLFREKPDLGYMSWTTGWAAYGLVHALRLGCQNGRN